jgi:hypothetical protein
VIESGIVAIGVLLLTGLLAVRVLPRREPVVSADAPALQAELERARRYGHAFTILRLPVDGGRTLAEPSVHLRSTDLAWVDGDDLYVFVPELEGDAIEQLVHRLADSTGTPMREEAAIATFPTDGLTLAALFARLRPAPRPAAWRATDRATDTSVARTAS